MNLTTSTLDRSSCSTALILVAPKQIVFIDRNITDHPVLTAGVLPGIATILLDLDSNGIDRITEVLARHSGLTAIHIVSHGASGSVQLGNGYLELDNLAEYTDRLRSWSKSLAADAEILLYGCEVAQGGSGAALVAGLGELTQARVVAKATKTGNPELGGDWDLAASVPLAFTAGAIAEYQGVLALPIISVVVTDANATETLAGQPVNPAEFTFTRVGGESVAKTFLYNLSGTATNGTDYTIPGSVTFAAGSSTATVLLTPTDDSIFEGVIPETAILKLIDDSYYDYSYYANPYFNRAATYQVDPANNTGTVNITDNDSRPTISISDTSITEGNTGNSNAAFTVTLSNPSTETVTVDYKITDGSATVAGNDYTSTLGTVTFAPGIISQIINVPIKGDYLVEGDETFTVDLSNATNATSITRSTATGTIRNDDTYPTVSVTSNGSVSEGNTGTTNAAFTVSLSHPTGETATVNLSTQDDTATIANNDYQGITNQVVTFAPGEISKVVNVLVNGDTEIENNETFKVVLSSPNSAISSIATSTATATIINDDIPTVTVVASDAVAAETLTGEPTNPGQFTLTRSGATINALTNVQYTLTGTATNGADYSITGIANFAAGVSTVAIDLNVKDDNLFEGATPETAILTLTANSTYAVGTAKSATVNIADNDSRPTVSITDAINITEGASGAVSNSVFTVALSNPSTETVTVDYKTTDGSATVAGNDYTSTTGTLTFLPGQNLTQVINVPVKGDLLVEGDETFTIDLSNAKNATSITRSTATGKILNDDAYPTISISDAPAITEGNTGTKNAAFTAKLDHATGEVVTVEISTKDATATVANNDYQALTNQVITFAPGQTSQVVNVLVNGDTEYEYNEVFQAVLSNPTKGSISQGTSLGTINNDDLPTITAVANKPDATETLGKRGQFTLTRSGPNDLELINIKYTLSGTATNGTDYSATSLGGFAAGSSTMVVDLDIIDDNIFEGATPETAVLTVVTNAYTQRVYSGYGDYYNNIPATYAIGTTNTATVNITDNDLRPTISIADISKVEGNSGVTTEAPTVTLSNPSTEAVTVDYTTADGTATVAGNDYNAATGTVTFAPGIISQVVNVPIKGDILVEGDETFTINLSNAKNATSITRSTATGTIINDDNGINVSVANPNVTEGGANGVYTLTRTGNLTNALAVAYTLSGTATTESDYKPVSGTVTFAAGAATASVNLTVIDDNVFEGATPETAILTVTPSSNYAIGVNTGTINITDNDLRPTISIADTSKTEADAGTSNAAFTVSLSNPSTETVTVDYATADGTATIAGNDYTAATGTVTFAPGQTSQVVNVPVVGDIKIEGNETFAVNLTNAKNATSIARSTATGTILDDDNGINVSVAEPNLVEGGANGVYTLTRTGVVTAALTVAYTLTGTATSGSDYQPVTGTATFAAGAATASVNLTVIDDRIFEGDTPETAILTLTPSVDYLIGNSNIGTINIADNDPRPTISINNVAIAEGNTGTSNAGFTVSLSNASTETITVDLSTQDGTATAGSDYQALTNQTVTFVAGQTSQVINVAVNGDLTFEGNETFSAGLSNPSNGLISSIASTGTGTINNDDLPTISVAVTDAEAAETLTGQPENLGEFTFTRVGGETVEKTFLYNLSGTATNGSDYTIPGSVTFAAGSTTAKIVLNPTDDTLFEGATPETAILTLIDDSYFDSSYYATTYFNRAATYRVDPANNTGTISIADNDSRPTISIADISKTEGNTGTSNAAFAVTLSNSSTETVTVDYTTADVNATAGSDYTATTGTVTFAPGQTSQVINVPVIGDLQIEGDETFSVNLTNAKNATGISRSTATGTILDDDNGINVSVTDPNAAEGGANGVYTLTRTGDLTNSIDVAYTLSGTATSTDYQPVTGIAKFAAGAATTSVNLTVIDDTIFEGTTPETAILTLTPSANYLLGTSTTGTINIADNDSRPVISINSIAIAEGNTGTSNAGFTVSLSNASTETVTVNLSTQDGTATTANSDYQAVTNQLVTFAPGQTSQVVNVAVNGDTVYEDNETFSAVLSGATNGTISLTSGTGTGTINNDDLPEITVAATIADASETPTKPGQFTLTRSGSNAAALADIKYTLTGTATNGADYTVSGVAAFAAGSSTMVVDLNVKDDNIFEGDTPETAILTVVSNAYQVATVLADGGNALAYAKFPATYAVGTTNTATVNIADNDLRPTVTIGNVTQAEGNSSTSNFGFNVALSNPTVETVTVDYSTADGTATVVGTTSLDPDYTAKSGTVTFTPGQTSQTINVAVNGDKDFEADKTFAVNLANPQNTTGITTAIGTGTITNDDTLPSITVNATNPISTEGKGEGLFTFYRTGGNVDRSLTIDFDVLGNATTRQGYGSRTGSITFAAGSSTATLGVPVANNTVYSAYRGCIVRLRSGGGYSIGGSIGSGSGGSGGSGGGAGGAGGSGGGGGGAGGAGGSGGASGSGGFGSGEATVTIVDDDTAPVISINDVSVAEGNDGTKDLTFTVSLNNASDDVVKVDYASADGTATAGSDYLATTGTLNFTPSDIIAGTTEFTPGETSKTITVKINGDTEIETNEAFTLNLTNAVGGTLGKATGTGTITNDDLPKVPVVVVPDNVPPTPIVPVPDVIVAPAVVVPTPIDIVPTPVVVAAPAVVIPTPIVPAPAVIAAPAVVVPTPIDIVPTPVVVAAPAVVIPAPIVPIPAVIAAPAVVVPTPIELVPTPVVVATPDVLIPAPIVPIPAVIVAPAVVIPTPIELVATPVVVATPDVLIPAPIVPKPELVVVPDVVIPAPIVPTIATNPIITVAATKATSTEGIGEGLFTFARTGGNINSALTIDFDLSGNATTRQGYGTRTGSVTFAAGSNTATLGVPVANNAVYNAARSCVVTLRKGSGYSFEETTGTAKVNIIDDEQAPVISIDDVTITEANGTKDLTFTVALSNASDDIVTVDYASADGTAIVDCDYTATTGTLSFAPSDLIPNSTAFNPGETRKTITVKINGDADVEDTETFRLNLKNAVGGSIGKATGTGTIENDDLAPIVIDSTPLIPTVIEKPPVIVDANPPSPVNNINPEAQIDRNQQLLGSSLQNIAEIIDLQSVSSNQTVQATFSVQRNAGYDNHVSFYKIADAQGSIITPTGITLKPGDAGYLAAAIQNRLTNIDLLGINGQTITSRSNVQGGAIYAPLIIANDKPDSFNLNFSNIYTAYSAANTDKVEHIRLLGNNTFGFEDTHSGGDKDFNDTIVTANFAITQADLVLDVVKLEAVALNAPTSVNLNLTGYATQPLKADIITNSNAAYNNNIGFYTVEDSIGTIKLSDGSFVKPGDANYAVEAIKNALTNSLQAGKNDTKTDLTITGGKIYAPVVIAQGTLNDFVSKNPTNGGGANDIHAYFNYLGANSDKTDHFRLIGNNTFGVEDMYGGGDKDFNDLVVSLKVKA